MPAAGLQVIALDDAGSDSKPSRVVYVSIFSIANCLGRLMSGYFPDKLMHKRRVARTIPLIIVTLLTLTAGKGHQQQGFSQSFCQGVSDSQSASIAAYHTCLASC